MTRLVESVLVSLLLLAVAWGSREAWARRRAERAVVAATFHADSLMAAADTTRQLAPSPSLRAAIGDASVAFQRRMVQARQEADSLDRALEEERAVKVEVSARADSLEAVLRAAVQDSANDERTASFSVYQPPYRVVAEVTLPPSPSDGRMTVRVAVDSAVFHARIGCGPRGAAGVRPATVTLVGPEWIRVRIANAEQVPEVCSAAAVRGDERPFWVPRFVAGVGAAVEAQGGAMVLRPAVFVGVGFFW